MKILVILFLLVAVAAQFFGFGIMFRVLFNLSFGLGLVISAVIVAMLLAICRWVKFSH